MVGVSHLQWVFIKNQAFLEQHFRVKKLFFSEPLGASGLLSRAKGVP